MLFLRIVCRYKENGAFFVEVVLQVSFRQNHGCGELEKGEEVLNIMLKLNDQPAMVL